MRSFMRLRQRMNVLFPHPDGPMSAVISFAAMSSVTPSSARFFAVGDRRARARRRRSRALPRGPATDRARSRRGPVVGTRPRRPQGWSSSPRRSSSDGIPSCAYPVRHRLPTLLVVVPQQDRGHVGEEGDDEQHHHRGGGQTHPELVLRFTDPLVDDLRERGVGGVELLEEVRSFRS